ncbi:MULTISPECIES: LysM peptidoglycan-binding domain-containing protein [unclassified Flavobacterium]|uniref:LysM peptidoglycan-binding domain-containing protein n=1 Tax=unclassified Flavobacterium TaxID=196869 RepID=UPI003F90BCC9
MNLKNATLSFLLLVSIPLFSQEIVENKGIVNLETNLSYLDSIKQTFVKDKMALCIDSLWMKELTNLDLYHDMASDVENINMDEQVDYDLSTPLLKSRLAAMNAKSPFRIEYNQSLENVIKSYLKYRKNSFGKLMALSEYYFPIFEEAFAKKNVPLEIKYLAIVESALNPKAVSRMGATGLWQFMYRTGKQYNLKIDSFIDERSDPLKATEAAAQYMANMYKIFGDWELVLASYNSGPGNVSKAIRRSGGQQNYWNIRKKLPKETQGYVPAFLATMYLYEYHNEHGIKPDRAIMQQFATDTVMVKKQMSFKQIADLLDMPVAQLQALNPSYKLNVIPYYDDENHYLRLPKAKTAVFVSNENKIYAYLQHEIDIKEHPYGSRSAIASNAASTKNTTRTVRTRTKYYKIRRGDNLGAIANKYKVSVANLKRWNRLRSNNIAYGKSLKIISTEVIIKTVPKKKPAAFAVLKKSTKEAIKGIKIKDEVVLIAKDTLKSSNNKSAFYVVQKGDNLIAIAKANQITVAQLKSWNNLKRNTIQLGETLQIAANSEKPLADVAVVSELVNIKYVVQKGDNLGSIAKKFGSSIAELKKWNNLDQSTITAGKNLIVAKNEVAISTNKASASTFKKNDDTTSLSQQDAHDYYVKKGDSLYSIAKKYPGVSISDIKKWNDISGEDIKPGMKLKING